MIWLDPRSPAVRSAVVSGTWGKAPHTDHSLPLPPAGEIDVIGDALRVASDILTQQTGYAVHPAGTCQEDFTCTPRARRLTPSFRPLDTITGVTRFLPDATTETVLEGWLSWQGSVIFGYGGSYELGNWYRQVMCMRPLEIELLRVTYTFRSSITASARRAVLELANQIWLEANGCDDCGECQLPARTTSVAREGLQYTLAEAADYLNSGRTGLPGVDGWVAGVNPRQALRRSAVFDPGAPPGVIHSLTNQVLETA